MKSKVNSLFGTALLCLVIGVGGAGAQATGATAVGDPRDVRLLDKLEVGHWVEVRGSLTDGGVFTARRIELTGPRQQSALWGPAERGAQPGSLVVLGRPIGTGLATDWRGGTAGSCVGKRIRVLGVPDRRGGISARRVEVRDPGFARIGGRIESLEQLPDGGVGIDVLGIAVEVPADVKQRSAVPLTTRGLAAAAGPYSPGPGDLDDFFGEGFVLGERLRLGLRHQLTLGSRRNFELDDPDDTDLDERDDRDDGEIDLRARLIWLPAPRLAAMLDLRHTAHRRDVGGGLEEEENRLTVGEAYLLFHDPASGIAVQLGRQDFDDAREWLYDQNLDGLRLARDTQRTRFELSLSTTLSDGSARDRDATNAILYLSNRSPHRHLAAYVVHREFAGDRDETQSHIGLRALGRWTSSVRGWAELAALTGTRSGRDVAAWGTDLGFSWVSRAPSRLTLSLGVAHGSGDRGGRRDERFRQTGLQDNNARLGGGTAVRYYGELMAPELSNITITTVGVGGRIGRRVSVELIGHTYRQAELSTQLNRTRLDQRPDGVHRDLGAELDLVIGFRRFAAWDVELVAAKFVPGDAFPGGESATLAKAQVRYRY